MTEKPRRTVHVFREHFFAVRITDCELHDKLARSRVRMRWRSWHHADSEDMPERDQLGPQK